MELHDMILETMRLKRNEKQRVYAARRRKEAREKEEREDIIFNSITMLKYRDMMYRNAILLTSDLQVLVF